MNKPLFDSRGNTGCLFTLPPTLKLRIAIGFRWRLSIKPSRLPL
jgi:hypothetical protein